LAQDALLASDACILCISPTPDEAVLVAPYLRAIEASGTPCLVFINRMDEPRGRLRDVIGALQAYSNHPLVLRQVPLREGDTVVGSCDLISERAWRYREGQPSALIELPKDVAEREHEARTEMLEQLSDAASPRFEQTGVRSRGRRGSARSLLDARCRPLGQRATPRTVPCQAAADRGG
jgi:elongation factor G